MKLRLTPRGTAQKVAIGASHAESSAFGATTKVVRLVSDVNCYVAFGAAPVATSSSLLMIAGVPEFFGVQPGEKVSVLEVSTTGNLSVAEGAQI